MRHVPDPDNRRAANHPWQAFTPQGETLLNPHGRPRRFSTALAARQALQRSKTEDANGPTFKVN